MISRSLQKRVTWAIVRNLMNKLLGNFHLSWTGTNDEGRFAWSRRAPVLKILSTIDLKSVQDVVWKKPAFFFGNHIEKSDDFMTEGVTKCIHEIENRRYFLPTLTRKYSNTSLPQLESLGRIVGVSLQRFRGHLLEVSTVMAPSLNRSRD